MGRHAYNDIEHGWLRFRSQCICGWQSPWRWRVHKAEAELFAHQIEQKEHS